MIDKKYHYKDGEYPGHHREEIDKEFYNWQDFYTKMPFYCGDGGPPFIFKLKRRNFREFPLFGFCMNLGLLAKYQYTWERRLKLYHRLLGIFYDYIHWRVIYSKNAIDFGMFLMKRDDDFNGQIRLTKPSKAEFTKNERVLIYNTGIRTQYVHRKVVNDVDFTRTQQEAQKSIKALHELVKENPQTCVWKRKQLELKNK
ncbi:MAG: hypothetical protein AB8G11_02425 [Saprospiraceae bacterium]